MLGGNKYSPELEKAARDAGFKNAEELVLFEEAKERRKMNPGVKKAPVTPKPMPQKNPAKPKANPMGFLGAINEALSRKGK